MTRGELLDRAFNILQDTRSEQRSYTEVQLGAYLDRGILLFRQEVEDKWYRYQVPLVANQSIYSFDSQHVRTQRLAFDDSTMEPLALIGLQAMDAKWQTTTGPEPWAWTSDGLPHDQFMVYPKPTGSSADVVSFVGEYGVVVRVQADGVDQTFTQQTGLVVDSTDGTFLQEVGEIIFADTVGLGQVEVWATLKPEPLTGDGDRVPLKCGYELAPLWYCIWQTYLEEGDHHDSALASYYKGMWIDLLERAQERLSSPLPNQVHVLGTSFSDTGTGWPRFESTMTFGGGPISVTWPRGRAWPVLGD
jgi:hypothetical protein